MAQLMVPLPPHSEVQPVTDVLHGIPVTDRYRWLEDGDSPRTRAWIEEQSRYARAYLDSVSGRDHIRQRIRDFLTVDTFDSLQRMGNRYFFRKRFASQEQPGIYMREGVDGEDQLLIDPTNRNTGKFTAVKPVQVSLDGNLLLYEVKQGGERTGTFELFDVERRETLPDGLPRGYLRGFAFAPDGKSFYYAHEPLQTKRPLLRAIHHHVIGSTPQDDQEIFRAGEDKTIRLGISADDKNLGLLVYRCLDRVYTDFYLLPFGSTCAPKPVLTNADYSIGPILLNGRILAATDKESPNFRIVEIQGGENRDLRWTELIPERDVRMNDWLVAGDRMLVSYIRQAKTEIHIFDLHGNEIGELPVREDETVRLIADTPKSDEVIVEAESFTEATGIYHYSTKSQERVAWTKRKSSFDPSLYGHIQVRYTSKDGTEIPMYLVGHHNVLAGGAHPTIMTSYGGYGVSMTPQFSVFVAFLLERGCLFALPNIRGGCEFGAEWYKAAKRRNRQTAYDDFLSAAQWLVNTGRTIPDKLAIFGGSNSGLLVGAAMTQRPDLFRAVVCMVPVLDMLRYHLFDHTHVSRDEFGTVDDAEDFATLLNYSPYHHVRDGVAYPATMIVSGSADGKCNPLHARKMTARLQAANVSPYPALLDYSEFRGHSPVLPLSERIEALTDRMAFLCDQLQLPVETGGLLT